MRNYIKFWYGVVNYSQVNPTPPPDTFNPSTLHFLGETEGDVNGQIAAFLPTLDPNFFHVDGYEVKGAFYWKLDKENLIEVLGIATGWWNFLGTDNFPASSPRKGWSHGH